MATEITVYSDDPVLAGSTTRSFSSYYGNSDHATVKGSFEATRNYNAVDVYISISMGNREAYDEGNGRANVTISSAPRNTSGSATFGVYGIADYNSAEVSYIFETSRITRTITLDNENSITLGIEEYVVYSYTPIYSGEYIFSFTDNSNLKGWVSTSTSDNSSNGYQASITTDLTANKQYYFCIKNTTKSNYKTGISCKAKLVYNPPDTIINFRYGSNLCQKIYSGASFDLDSISSLGFSKTGWIFNGWAANYNTTSIAYLDGTSYDGVIGQTATLYAVWQKSISATAYYGLNNSSSSILTGILYSYNISNTSSTEDTTASVSLPNIQASFTYDGRNFLPNSWGKLSNGQYTYLPLNTNTSINGGESFYLRYLNDELTLSYDKNNDAATGEMDDSVSNQYYINNAFEEVEFNVATPLFVLSDFNFNSWNTNNDGTGNQYTPNSSIFISSNTVLYAIWGETSSLLLYYKYKPIKAFLRKNNKYYEIVTGMMNYGK